MSHTDLNLVPAVQEGGSAPVPVVAPLPPAVVWTHRAAASLRAFLVAAGLGDYQIFHGQDLGLHDVDEHLHDLDPAAGWTHSPDSSAAHGSMGSLSHDARLLPAGFLRLDRHRVVLARWHWVSDDSVRPCNLWLAAAPDAATFRQLRQENLRLRRRRAGASWTILTGMDHGPTRSFAAGAAADDLILSTPLRQRLETEIVRFFDDPVAALYHSLHVPYRRGLLMHGPPGNGKTSLIRWIGSAVPRVPGMVLRPYAGFDSDDLAEVIGRWVEMAPAIFVIEDLDWLLARVNVSTFLNLIDGIDSAATGGLLLIATTNHPDKLDPAVNNRPGRFDVVIEIPNPDAGLRRRFFQARLGTEVAATVLAMVASLSEGLSFAHLQEILRLSGLMAIHAGRRTRSDEDVLAAARTVRDSSDDATRGFLAKPEVPFGLSSLRAAQPTT